jgi:hypothetical protein
MTRAACSPFCIRPVPAAAHKQLPPAKIAKRNAMTAQAENKWIDELKKYPNNFGRVNYLCAPSGSQVYAAGSLANLA